MTKKDKQLSLSIKTDENTKAMPLGIKSTVEGIEHFTNWDNVSNSIGETGGRLRKEQTLYNNLRFRTERYRVGATDVGGRPSVYAFEDEWSINKIKILDDLAFVAQDEYTDVQKITKTVNASAYQLFVERDFVGVMDNDDNAGDGDGDVDSDPITSGYSSWTASGTYTGHMTFLPGSGYSAGPYGGGGVSIKYTPSSNLWQVTGTVPSDGGWGGTFTGSATYDACSGGATTNVDITVTGTHYCTTTSHMETYSGTLRLNITPGNSTDESACSAAMTINSVAFGFAQYSSSGGCYISYSDSSISYNGYSSTSGGCCITYSNTLTSYEGYTPPVFPPAPDPPPPKTSDRNITIQRRIGSLAVSLGSNTLFSGRLGNLSDGKFENPLNQDFHDVYIKIKNYGVLEDSMNSSPIYFKFGGFVNNDFGRSNIYKRGEESEPDSRTLGGIDFKSKNTAPNRKLKGTNGNIDTMGDFLPPFISKEQNEVVSGIVSFGHPVNYSVLQSPAYPAWGDVPNYVDIIDRPLYDDWLNGLVNFGWIGNEQIFDGVAGKPTDLFGGLWKNGEPLCSEGGGYRCADFMMPLCSKNSRTSITDWKLDPSFQENSPYFQAALLNRKTLPNPKKKNGSFVGQGDFKSDSPNRVIVPLVHGHEPIPLPNDDDAIGSYYLIYDDTDLYETNPRIVGIQFDQVLNSVSAKQKLLCTDKEGEGGYRFLFEQSRLMKASIDLKLEITKLLPVRKCGKVDIYRRKAGKIRSVSRYGLINSLGNNLKQGDIIEISGAVYETPPSGTGDIHPLNGRFVVNVLTDNSFSLIDGPSVEVYDNLRSDELSWRSVSNDASVGMDKDSEGWEYQKTIFSPTGKNGYFNGVNKNYSYGGDPSNRLATEEEFVTNQRIDLSNLDETLPSGEIESGSISLGSKGGVRSSVAWHRNLRTGTYLQNLFDAIPETPEGMILGTDRRPDFGASATQYYPYVADLHSRSFGGLKENYSGCRFGCDIDVKYSNDSGYGKIYTLAVGEIGSDISVDLFGLQDDLCHADDEILKFTDSKRLIPQYLPYGKTHIINIRVDQYNRVTNVDHRDSLFGGGNGIRHGTQPRGNDLLEQTERNPWSDFELELRRYGRNSNHKYTKEIALSEILLYEEEYLGNYLNAGGSGSRARYYKSGYWERHAVMHWYNQNIPRIYSFRGGQVDERFIDPIERDFGLMNRPILEQDDDQNILSYFGDQTGAQTIDRFNSEKKTGFGERGYWSIFPWVDSYGKSVSINTFNNLQGLSSNVGLAVLSASTSKANRTFTLDQTELPAPSYPKGRENIPINRESAQIGQLNLVYLQTNSGNSYDQFGYTQISSGGTSGFPTRGFSKASKYKSGLTGTYAGNNIAEVMSSCHLSCSNVVLEKDRILFSEQAIAENKSIIYIFDFNPSSIDPISKNHTISRDFNFPRNSRLIDSAASDGIFNVGDGFGSSFKVDKNLLLTNATDIIDEFDQPIRSPQARSSNVTSSVAYGVDQIFVYEKLKSTDYEIFEFSQKITASTREKVSENYRDRRLTLVDDLTVPLGAMNYENRPNGTYAWNIRLAGRYDIADTKIVLQDPQSVAVFDRDFSEYKPMIGDLFITTPQSASAKIEKFSHQDTSVLTYEDAAVNTDYLCRINIADYQKLRGQYHSLPEQTPILNYSIDGEEDLYISSMTVSFNLRDIISDISTTHTRKLGSRALVPRVVLYSRDPQEIVTRNRSTDLNTGVSNFYSLDDTRKSKRRGAYIAPESAETSDLFLQYNTGFMGQHRGGAQDLFFYGTLEDSEPRTAQEVFAGDTPRSTLPYTYGGEKNLADFDSGCSWIAPDVYHKFSQQEINQIKPYAKIFNPTLQADGTYSITITSDDLDFDDYIEKTSGIWIGFVLTNVNSFDINTSKITYQELSNGEIKDNSDISYLPIDDVRYSNNMDGNIGPYKYILPSTIDGLSDGSMDMSRWVNARYPYCRVGVYPSVDSQGAKTAIRNKKGRSPVAKSLSCFAEATVVNPTLEISGFVTEGRRYKTSFSKNAIIDLKDGYTQSWFDGEANAVVAISDSNTSANTPDFKGGTTGNSYQIMSSTFGAISTDTFNSLDRGKLRDVYRRTKPSNIISSFDVEQPEFVSLVVDGEQVYRDVATLFTPTPFGVSASGVSLILSPVVETKEGFASLFTGQRDFEGIEPLFLKVDIAENNFTLNIHEIQPSAIVPLMLNVVDASGGFDLNFAPPTTGDVPLFVSGPLVHSGLTPLGAAGSAFIDEGISFYTSGAFHSSGVTPLNIVSSISSSGLFSLAMNLPQSGSVPLYIRKDFDASGQAPLTIFDKAPHSGSLNLFTGTQYDVFNKDLSIFIDVPLIGTGQVPLRVDGFALDANSNRNSNSAFLSSLPDGEFDKGDPDGNFNEDPISKTSSSKTVLSNSALGNAVNENFYDRNRSLVSDTNLSLLTDSNYPFTFAAQKNVGNRRSPSRDKRGTSDPAWNLAFDSRSSNTLDSGIAANGSSISHRQVIKKFYTGNQSHLQEDRLKSTLRCMDFMERDFYDTNDDVLVKAGEINGNAIEISIYDIDDDGNLSQRGAGGKGGILRFSPCSLPLDEYGGLLHGFWRGPDKDKKTIEGTSFRKSRFTNGPPNLDLDIGGVNDAFYPIRREIFKAIKSDFTDDIQSEDYNNQPPFAAIWNSGRTEILDLKVSKNGMCAISFRALFDYEFYYKDGPTNSFTQSHTRRKLDSRIITSVLIFDISSYIEIAKGEYSFLQNYNNSFLNQFITYPDDDYYHNVMPSEQNKQTVSLSSLDPVRRSSPFTASSIAFDYDDLYVNLQDGFQSIGQEGVVGLRKSSKYNIVIPQNYNTFSNNFVSFVPINTGTDTERRSRTTDADYYHSSNNRRYIADASDGYNKPFFGSKVKIFEEYESDKSIMLVGAMLLDPYVLQNLSRSHNLNPFGAVYIYKKDKDQDDWDYHGAVYGKGYTSENISSNLSEFDTGSTYNTWNRRVGLFGYDFDYSEGVLFVSEPGGSGSADFGESAVNPANIYAFDISSAPSLIRTHNASDISINSSSLAAGDGVGTHIAAFGRQDVFSFSDAALYYMDRKRYSVLGNATASRYPSLRYEGESLIHNFRNGSSFGFGSDISGGVLEYSRGNTLNELRPYFTDLLKSGAYPELSSIQNVWSRILSIKKISSKNKDRLLVVRKFAFRLNDYTAYRLNSFNVVKLQVVDLERDHNGTLFIKAANVENNFAPLYNLAPGPSGKVPLAIKPIDYCSGLLPLFLDNRNVFESMSLHTPHADADGNVFLPLAMDAFAPSASGQSSLFLKHQYVTADPSLFMPTIGIENSDFSLAAKGSFGEGFSSNPTLVINEHIPGVKDSGNFSLFLNQINFSATPLSAAGGPSGPAVDLVIGTFAVASGVSQVPLGIKTFIPPVGPGGGYIASGNIPIVMAGNNDAGVYYDRSNTTSLFLGANAMAASGNVLFIEKAYGEVSPLYIDSRISSGNIPSFVGGTAIDNSGMSLITKVAATGNFNIFTRGFFD